MLIINENKLIHTDDFNDVIEHFGIKGMKLRHRSLFINLKCMLICRKKNQKKQNEEVRKLKKKLLRN